MDAYGLIDGTVYLASDGHWYRWPVATPYASEAEARAAAPPPPPPPPASAAWTSPPVARPTTLLPADVDSSAGRTATAWVKAHKVVVGVAAFVLIVAVGALGGDKDPKPSAAQLVTATEAPVPVATEAPPPVVNEAPAPPAPVAVVAAPVYRAPPATKAAVAAPPPVAPKAVAAPAGDCDPSYPDVCIPPGPPDLDCGEVPYDDFRVVGEDYHGFDADHDGIGCET